MKNDEELPKGFAIPDPADYGSPDGMPLDDRLFPRPENFDTQEEFRDAFIDFLHNTLKHPFAQGNDKGMDEMRKVLDDYYKEEE